jgi:CheY-like chemotaxis protein
MVRLTPPNLKARATPRRSAPGTQRLRAALESGRPDTGNTGCKGTVHLLESLLQVTLDQPDYAVLLVEDEPIIRMVAAYALEDAGLRCFEAENADEAFIKLAQHSDIRLLFTDINMPGSMDGLALAAAVHERHPNIELIVTSGRRFYRDDELPDDGTFIPKPYRAERLIEVVRRKLAPSVQP